jgi:ABC-type methionine transport system permease subunit
MLKTIKKKNSIILKRLFKIILIILSIPFLLLIILIYPILKIRINELETRALGHFSITTEIFLNELKRNIHGKKKTIYLWFTNS